MVAERANAAHRGREESLAEAIGIVLVARGKGRFGLFSGLALFGFAAGEGFRITYAILGWPLATIVNSVFYATVFGVRYLIVEAAHEAGTSLLFLRSATLPATAPAIAGPAS